MNKAKEKPIASRLRDLGIGETTNIPAEKIFYIQTLIHRIKVQTGQRYSTNTKAIDGEIEVKRVA